jgi:hypothetical protein
MNRSIIFHPLTIVAVLALATVVNRAGNTLSVLGANHGHRVRRRDPSGATHRGRGPGRWATASWSTTPAPRSACSIPPSAALPTGAT